MAGVVRQNVGLPDPRIIRHGEAEPINQAFGQPEKPQEPLNHPETPKPQILSGFSL